MFAEGVAALEASDYGRAESLFESIVAAQPRLHAAWNALSVVAVRAGSPEVAAERARRALELDRRNPLYLNSLGVACGELRDFAAAETQFRRALKQKPDYAEAHYNLGKLLHKKMKLADSLRAFERAYAMAPDLPGVRVSFAHLQLMLGHPARALELLRESPGAITDRVATDLMRYCIEQLQGEDAAAEYLKSEISGHPDVPTLRTTLAFSLLGVGRWREGWESYLWRPGSAAEHRAPSAVRILPRSLAGEKILLHAEQGLGDVLFFLRFAAELRARGAHVALRCGPRLARLLAASDAIDQCLVDDSSAPHPRGFDHALWIGDLPWALEADGCPPPVALRCDAEIRNRVRSALAAFGPPPYLGMLWRAGTDMLRSREFGNRQDALSKEVPSAALGRAVRGWKGTLLSLQRDPYPGELEGVRSSAGASVTDVAGFSADLLELLALLELLDEYVAVSSTNIHIRAGIGKTAHVLVPYPAEWRWMRGGAQSPWFPGFSLYRQRTFTEDWAEPLARLRRDLIG